MSILKDKLEFDKKIKISYLLKSLEKIIDLEFDNDSELFNIWFEFSPIFIKKKKTIDERHSKNKNENHCNCLTPAKSTTLKRLPTHSYNNLCQSQKQNL